MINFEKLYKPYAGKASLEETVEWLNKEASKRGISQSVIEDSLIETMLELSSGKEFDKDGGDTGFDDIPHACLNIYMLEKAIEMHRVSMTAFREATEGRIQDRIESYLKCEERKKINRRWLFRWQDSQILRLFKWIISRS